MKSNIFVTTFLLFIFCVFVFAQHAMADSVVDNGLQFIRSKQDLAGRITTGFSAPSQWSAIAFAANGIDISTVSATATSSSLLSFLESDAPASSSAATDWESRILAIVDTNYDPTKFNGTNYVQNLEKFYNTDGYLGDYCSFNGDIFGLLAFISAGPAADNTIKQNMLKFIISKQDASGGFSWLTDNSCSTSDYPYAVSADMTGAAAVALAEAKNHGLVTEGLDNAIGLVSAYLSNNNDADGGWGFYGASDTDTTGWVLQGLNALDLGDSVIAQNAKNYLTTSPQLGNDNGITSCQWNYNTSSCDFVSNATTTAQALIGLLGKDWILRIYDPLTALQTPTDTPSPTPASNAASATPTPTPASNAASATPTPTATPVSTITPTPTDTLLATNQLTVSSTQNNADLTGVQPSPTSTVLGSNTQNKIGNNQSGQTILPKFLISLGVVLFATCGILIVKRYRQLN